MNILSLNEFTTTFIPMFYKHYKTWVNNKSNIGKRPHFHIRITEHIDGLFGINQFKKIRFEKTTEGNVVKRIFSEKLKPPIVKSETTLKLQETKIDHIYKVEKETKNTLDKLEEIEVKKYLKTEYQNTILFEEKMKVNEYQVAIPFHVDFWDCANLNSCYFHRTEDGFLSKYETSSNERFFFFFK